MLALFSWRRTLQHGQKYLPSQFPIWCGMRWLVPFHSWVPKCHVGLRTSLYFVTGTEHSFFLARSDSNLIHQFCSTWSCQLFCSLPNLGTRLSYFSVTKGIPRCVRLCRGQIILEARTSGCALWLRLIATLSCGCFNSKKSGRYFAVQCTQCGTMGLVSVVEFHP